MGKFPVGDEPLARNTDPETSHLSGKELRANGRLGLHQERVLRVVVRHEGKTQGEYHDILLLEFVDIFCKTTTSPRFAELKRRGYIYAGEKRPCDVTGKLCLTWWPTQAGKETIDGQDT